jgi:hypothetical protein
MDEVERSMARTRPPRDLEEARHKPASLLLGMTVGIACAWLAGIVVIYFAPLLPLLVGVVMTFFKRTQAVALGVLSAASGVAVFLATMALLFMVF